MDVDAKIAELYALLKSMKPKDMTDQQYEVFCMLDNLLGE